MIGTLTNNQIDHVLHRQSIGRVACSSDKKLYVVPVTYVYHKEYIYARSKEGQKIRMMRQNPSVCFQVDIIENMNNWRSVIVWGAFEELKTEEEQKLGREIMEEGLGPYRVSESVRPSSQHSHAPEFVEKELKAVAYRIKVTEKTGRYEKE